MVQGTTAAISPAIVNSLPPTPHLRRGAILVVEDHDDVRHGLSQLLEFQGYVVCEAADANEAFAHLESGPASIALILLDLDLPGRNGAEIRAGQLADPRLATIPIVVVSACAPDLDRSAALQASAWVEKPYPFDQLLGEIKRFVLPW